MGAGVGGRRSPQGPAGGREGAAEEVMGEVCTDAAGKGCWSRRADGASGWDSVLRGLRSLEESMS